MQKPNKIYRTEKSVNNKSIKKKKNWQFMKTCGKYNDTSFDK